MHICAYAHTDTHMHMAMLTLLHTQTHSIPSDLFLFISDDINEQDDYVEKYELVYVHVKIDFNYLYTLFSQFFSD